MIFLKDRNCCSLQLEDYYKRLNKVTDNLYDAKVLITWSDIPLTENKQILMAKELGIKTFVIQHGRNATVDYDPDYLDLNGNSGQKFIGDYFFVWGEPDRQRLLKSGVNDSQIIITGSPLIPCQIPEIAEKKFVVFLSHHDLRPDFAKINEEVHATLAKKYGLDYLLVYSAQYLNEPLTKIEKDIKYTRIKIDGADRSAWLNMMSILRKAKCVVSIMASSFEGLSMCFGDIPIVRVACDLGVRDKEGKVEYENSGTHFCDTNTLIDTIEKVKPEELKEQRLQIARDEYGLDYLPALPIMTKEINKWL